MYIFLLRLRMCWKNAAWVFAGLLQQFGAVQSDSDQRRSVSVAETNVAKQCSSYPVHADHSPQSLVNRR